MLLGEIKGQKSRKAAISGRNKRSSSKESRLSSNEDSKKGNDFSVENSVDESKNDKNVEETAHAEVKQHEESSAQNFKEKEVEESAAAADTTAIEKAIEPVSNPTFEVLALDSNTERKFLENISFNQPDHISEGELKSTIFNSYKTIETLQQDLM